MSFELRLDSLHGRVIANPWLQFFTAVTRVLLAMAFVPSGLVKIQGHPFTTLPLTDPVGFFFAGFFQAQGFYRFVGVAQWTAAALLLITPTSTLGAALYLPISVNIFVITVSVGFQGTTYITGMMLLANIYLICWDYDRWKGILPGFCGSRSFKPRNVSASVMGLLILSAGVGISSVLAASMARLRGNGMPLALVTLTAGAVLGLTALWRHYRATRPSRVTERLS